MYLKLHVLMKESSNRIMEIQKLAQLAGSKGEIETDKGPEITEDDEDHDQKHRKEEKPKQRKSENESVTVRDFE